MVTIDGKEAHKVENKDPRTFKDVKVFAGDNFHTASDASYKNLVWENGEEDLNCKREKSRYYYDEKWKKKFFCLKLIGCLPMA